MRAMGAHGLHSPFVFDLYNQVIKKCKNRLPAKLLEVKRRILENDQVIDVIDFKSGSARRSTVAVAAQKSISRERFMNFLRQLTDYLQVRAVLETGTSLGLNSLSLAESDSVEKVVSIEGSDIIHQLAKKNCQDNPKIHLVRGDLYEQLGPMLIRHQPQLIFLDADHRRSALEFCLEQISLHCLQVKCIVIHDIYWSKNMEEAWNDITSNPKYSLTIDLFQAGLIFPNHPIVKQHFTLRF